MKAPVLLFSLVLSTTIISMAQTLYVPGGTGGISSSTNTNVGIGTNTPAYKLDVGGTIRKHGDLILNGVGTANGIYADDGVGSIVFSIWSLP